MKQFILAAALALSAAPAWAQDAHGDNAEVVSVPADDAVLATAPASLSLTFEHAVVLTQVQVHGPGHTAIPVAFTAPSAATASYSIPLPDTTMIRLGPARALLLAINQYARQRPRPDTWVCVQISSSSPARRGSHVR